MKWYYFAILVVIGCKESSNEPVHKFDYTGPLYAFNNVEMFISDSGIVKGKLMANERLILQNGDQHYPCGLNLEFFDDEGAVTTTFRADDVYQIAVKQQYKCTGNVIVRSLESGDQLNTELLYYEQRGGGKFHTDQFVTIKSDGEIHTGQGLESNVDFTEYRIVEPNGTIAIENFE